MTSNGIPPPVASFLRDHVSSIELLEVLLLLHGNAARSWTADSIAAELRIQPRSCGMRCSALVKLGAVTDNKGTMSFDTSSSLVPTVDALAEAYRTHRVAIIELIFSRPAGASKAFADAFIVKKGGNSDG